MQRVRNAVEYSNVTPPRQIEKGQLCFVTVRAVNRSFRFVPKRRVCEAIWYCLAAALDKFDSKIAAHEFLFMSNHFHLTLTDTEGCMPKFMEYFDSLLARALNAIHGTTGTVIEKGYNRVVADQDSFLEHCVYTLANPCAAHLVARSRQWKGVSSLKLEYGVPVTIKRPKAGLWAEKLGHANRKKSQRSKRAQHAGRSKLLPEIKLVLHRPAVRRDLKDAELRAQLRERLAQREAELIAERRAKNIRVVGWGKLVEQPFWKLPPPEERFGRVPSFSAKDEEARMEALERRRRFIGAYYAALKKYVDGILVAVFPEGTWLMRQRFGVPCRPLPDS